MISNKSLTPVTKTTYHVAPLPTPTTVRGEQVMPIGTATLETSIPSEPNKVASEESSCDSGFGKHDEGIRRMRTITSGRTGLVWMGSITVVKLGFYILREA